MNRRAAALPVLLVLLMGTTLSVGGARKGRTSVEGNVGKLQAGVRWFTFGAWK